MKRDAVISWVLSGTPFNSRPPIHFLCHGQHQPEPAPDVICENNNPQNAMAMTTPEAVIMEPVL